MTKRKYETKKAGFTLAEGTPNLTCAARHAFTLAEVLIVIGVIGVVAAITIPTLINTISEKAKKSQTDVIEARLLDGINRYSATEDGLSQKYASTYDFLIGLSNYYKMAQICKADEIEKCIPYSKIYSADGKLSVNVSSLKTIDKFVSGEAAKKYLAPASFISAQGTPIVMALKKDCVWDMGQAMRSVEDSGCIAYLYDKIGTGLPNRIGDNGDIVGHGLTVNGFPLAILGGVKIMTNVFPITTCLSLSECQTEAANQAEYKAINSDVYIKGCYYDTLNGSRGDCWAQAMKYCKEKGYHLPTDAQLTAMANALYPDVEIQATGTTYGNIDKTLIPEPLSGLSSSWYYLWSGSELSTDYAYTRDFGATWSGRNYNDRTSSSVRAVCVGD